MTGSRPRSWRPASGASLIAMASPSIRIGWGTHSSVAEQQRVEIVRCLLQSPKLLIMDEPTSVLTPQAVQQLFDTLRRLAAEGMSILYISHKLDEIRSLCDNATVLRT